MPATPAPRPAEEQTVEMNSDDLNSSEEKQSSADALDDTAPLRQPTTSDIEQQDKKEATFEDKLTTTMVEALSLLEQDYQHELSASQVLKGQDIKEALQDVVDTKEAD